MAELAERVDNLEKEVSTIKSDVEVMKTSAEKAWSKIFRRFDTLDNKVTKMMKWIYRLLSVIILLLFVIAVKSPSTASQIVSGTGAIVKAF